MINRLLLGLIFISFSINSCNLLNPNEETPNGTSTLSAKINGVSYTFTNVVSTKIIGYYGTGSSNGYTIRLNLSNGLIGDHKWGNYAGPNYLDSSATLNWMPALLNIGGFNITNLNTSIRLIEGSFNFSVVDTSKNDTIRVQNGLFSFYYVDKE